MLKADGVSKNVGERRKTKVAPSKKSQKREAGDQGIHYEKGRSSRRPKIAGKKGGKETSGGKKNPLFSRGAAGRSKKWNQKGEQKAELSPPARRRFSGIKNTGRQSAKGRRDGEKQLKRKGANPISEGIK